MLKKVFKNRLLLWMILPVVVIGALFSFLLNQLLVPPITQLLQDRTDASLKHISVMGLSICEREFNALLELRMEDNEEMNESAQKEAIEQIKNLELIFPSTKILIVDKNTDIIDSSFSHSSQKFQIPKFRSTDEKLHHTAFGREHALMSYKYFPFWRWYIVSLIFEKDYRAPIIMAKQIVTIGTFGVLGLVSLIVFFLFIWRINTPLKKIITATEKISEGNLSPIEVKGKDEISQVSMAFNSMVSSLIDDQNRINSILRKLRDSEEQYRILTESSLAYISMIQDDRFVFANRRMLNSLNYTPEQFLNMKFWEIVHSDDGEWVKGKIDSLKKGTFKQDHFECRVITKYNESVWFEILSTRILYQEKSAILIHAIDRTSKKEEQKERKNLEEKLARAEKMEAIGSLAGGVAHDLNNILSAVVGYPDILLLKMDDNDPSRKSIEAIQRSGIKAARIVQDMLTLARRGVKTNNLLNINEIIREYLNSPEYLKLKSFHPMVQIQTSFYDSLLNIKGSGVHISKTIMNLVSNASEAMPDGGIIHIMTRNEYIDSTTGNYELIAKGDYVTVKVSDSGIGIPNDDLANIFEPFYTKKVMGRSGTGLGMAVVWGTVKDHGGYIDLESQVDTGTTFTLYFPVTREEIQEEEEAFTIEKYIGKGESVLVVDDVEEQLDLASSMLTQLGYSVSVVSSGEEAVSYLEKNKVDLLVLDMIMDPGIDGYETYKRILEFHPHQKAIIASGFSKSDSVIGAQKIGAGQYLKKPYTLEKLGTAVKKELGI